MKFFPIIRKRDSIVLSKECDEYKQIKSKKVFGEKRGNVKTLKNLFIQVEERRNTKGKFGMKET